MPVKTFTSERLTSGDVNNFLANAGLDYIGVSTATAAVNHTVSGFSSTYENYRLVISNLTTNTTGAGLFLQFALNGTAAATNYYSALNGYTYAGAGAFNNVNNGTVGIPAITHATIPAFLILDISRINVAANTQFSSIQSGGIAMYSGAGYHGTATAYNQCFFTAFAGAPITATFRLYGYRQA